MEPERSKIDLQVNKDNATGVQASVDGKGQAYIAKNITVTNNQNTSSDEPIERKILLLPASLRGADKPSRATEIRRTARAINNSREENVSKDKNRPIYNVLDKDKSDIEGSELSRLLSAINPYIVDISGFEEGIANLVIKDLENSKIEDVDQFISQQFQINAPEIHCIILNGCYAENQATNLIQHIEFLISVGQELSESLVFNFLDEFYYRIGLGWPIDRAYQAGCHELKPFESDQTKFPILRNAEQEKELVLINKKIQEEPSNVTHWNQKASKLQEIGRYKEADQAYARATSLEPQNPLLREEQGDFLEQSGKHEEAASAYKKSSQLLGEKDYRVLWKVGKAYAKADLYSEAVNFYKQALYLEPPMPDNYLIWREYGHVLDKDGRYNESIAAYKKALKYQPKYRASRYEQRWLYRKIYSRTKWMTV